MNLEHIINEAIKGNHIAIVCRTRIHAIESYLEPIIELLHKYRYPGDYTYSAYNLSIDITPGRITCFIGSKGPEKIRGLLFDNFYYDGDSSYITQETMKVLKYNTGRRL